MIFMLFPGIRATENAIKNGLIRKEDLDLLGEHPYNLLLSILAINPERSPDAVRICNLQKFSIFAVRLPFLEPIIRLLVELPPNNLFSHIFSFSQAWEYRKWSSRTTFRRLLYEGLLNYQALVEGHGDKGGLLRKISLMLSKRVKKKMQASEGSI